MNRCSFLPLASVQGYQDNFWSDEILAEAVRYGSHLDHVAGVGK